MDRLGQFRSEFYLEQMNRDFQEAIRFLRSRQSHVVIDVGCGVGHFAAGLNKEGFLSIGVDTQKQKGLLSIWKALSHKFGCAFIVGDTQHLPFREMSVDTVFAYAHIEHVKSPARTISEFGRVLQNGGWLLIFKCPRKLSIAEQITRCSGYLGHGHKRLITEAELKLWLSNAGFKIIEVQRVNLIPYFIPSENIQSLWNLHATILMKLDDVLSRCPLNILAHFSELIMIKTPLTNSKFDRKRLLPSN